MTDLQIIVLWCKSMGYPAPKPGDCMALLAALRVPMDGIPSEAC